ncbi:hypothetical protein ACT3TI_13895 [Psychrobacter sp. AOP22-C1-22]|uniref:hypothetical protein n=1 Tax=unclassified Psychrobacter TaxID=196806 RepID=UPI00178797C7|nr:MULTISPECIES: hypothetical protein [unclassified Psychrobacter]MBE0408001.1 hypothetical protein [Psychrobacter sp. FME6]MBE0446005.1 hypothetical protein [Psychrobacter sp. FME5]MDN5802270.1 hypothetical protein [Psychrobacter sp.]MDN5897206.1 hypothetical protein [Psychrobacter sp.]
MPFNEIMTDTIKILKQNGEVVSDIKSSVQKNKIFIQRSDILVEIGDLIQRSMSNGAEETYKVIDPGFHEKLHSIPAGYQMDVIKLGLPEAKAAVQHVTYNISGVNNRFSQNSTDNSVNIVNSNSEIQEHIVALRDEISRLNLSKEEQRASYEVIDAVEAQFGDGKPSKAVVQMLLNGLPNAGSIATISSFFLSLLDKL